VPGPGIIRGPGAPLNVTEPTLSTATTRTDLSRSCGERPPRTRPLAGSHSRWVRSRSALEITLTEESAIAAAAMTGESSRPDTG
jgi:hypothetical protein